MAETYRVLFHGVDVLPLTDGLAAIYNAETSDQNRYFEVTRVAVRPYGVFGGLSGTLPLSGKLSAYRTTATSGGEAVAAIKRDTGSADLPAEVTCTIYPSSVTTTGNALRGIIDAPSMIFASTNQWLAARVYGGSYSAYMRQNNADTLRFSGDANVERIVLREGEGVALVLGTYGWPRSGQVNITLREETTGETYQYRSRDIGTPALLGQAYISLFNGSGSGVVLGVNSIEFPLDGEHNFPVFRMARIDGVLGGETVTPMAADTANSAPAALVCTKGDFNAKLVGEYSGVPYDWNYTHGLGGMTIASQQKAGQVRGISGIDLYWNVGQTPGLQIGQDETILWNAKSGAGIVLRPGDGFALLAGRAGALETSTFAYLEVEMTVIHYPPAAAAGNTYSRSRVVNA